MSGRAAPAAAAAVVLDASVAVAWYVLEARSEAAARLQRGGDALLAPALLLVEVANALLRRRRRGFPAPEGHLASVPAELRAGHVAYTPDADLLDDAADLADRLPHPVYDCLYLALALREGAALATFDADLAALAARVGVPLWSPDADAPAP